MNIVQRMKAPTPKFFRVLRTIGLALAAASGALLAAPVALPAAVITIAGYVAVAGSVVTAMSQTAIPKEEDEDAYDDPSNHGDNRRIEGKFEFRFSRLKFSWSGSDHLSPKWRELIYP